MLFESLLRVSLQWFLAFGCPLCREAQAGRLWVGGRQVLWRLVQSAGVFRIGLLSLWVCGRTRLRRAGRAHFSPVRHWRPEVTFLPKRRRCSLSVPTAHQNRVSAIIFSLAAEWVISTGHDKCVSWMCTRSGNMLGKHFFTSWASCLQYDFDTQYAFVGDYSGQITLLKLEQNTCSVITTLKGHEGRLCNRCCFSPNLAIEI